MLLWIRLRAAVLQAEIDDDKRIGLLLIGRLHRQSRCAR